MARMITNLETKHHMLEIVDPRVDKNEHEITKEEFNIRKIYMGPLTTEGNIYHAKFSVGNLSKRVKATERKIKQFQIAPMSLPHPNGSPASCSLNVTAAAGVSQGVALTGNGSSIPSALGPSARAGVADAALRSSSELVP